MLLCLVLAWLLTHRKSKGKWKPMAGLMNKGRDGSIGLIVKASPKKKRARKKKRKR